MAVLFINLEREPVEEARKRNFSCPRSQNQHHVGNSLLNVSLSLNSIGRGTHFTGHVRGILSISHSLRWLFFFVPVTSCGREESDGGDILEKKFPWGPVKLLFTFPGDTVTFKIVRTAWWTFRAVDTRQLTDIFPRKTIIPIFREKILLPPRLPIVCLTINNEGGSGWWVVFPPSFSGLWQWQKITRKAFGRRRSGKEKKERELDDRRLVNVLNVC